MITFIEIGSKKELTKVNLNKATSGELERIPGFGPKTANLIIEYRNQNGKFKSVEDLVLKVGLRQRIVDQISYHLEV